MHTRTTAAIFLTLAAATAPVDAEVTRLVIFGDSLSDTGNILARTAENIFITDRPTLPWYSTGRWTNGADNTGPGTPQTQTAQSAASGVWHERLAAQLGIAAATNSIAGGRNFAFGGAVTGGGTFTPNSLNIGAQFQQYRNAALANTETTLFTFWGGGNDLRDAARAGGATRESILAAADTSVNNIRGYINTLKTQVHPNQTVNVLWPNVPPLDRTPDAQALPANLRTALADASTRFRTLENEAITALAGIPGLVIFNLDIHTLFGDIIAGRLDDFRPTNTTNNIITASDFSGLGFTPTRNITPATPAGLNPDNYVFWDQIHPTSRVHRAIGDYAVTVIPTPSAVVLFAAGLIAGMRRRR